MRKKFLISFFSITMALAMIGCGAKEEASAPAASQEPEVVAEEGAVEEVAEEEPELTVEELEAMIKEEFNDGDPNHNRDQVEEWCNQAIEMGSGYAMYVLSCEYLKDEDYEKTLELAHNSADKNEALGYNVLAYCYQYGKGVDIDLDKAIEYANKEIELGEPSGYAVLGNLYSGSFEGIEKDYAKMFENYKAYCELKSEYIDYSYYGGLGICYLTGTGVEKDVDTGLEWIEKADEHGNIDSSWILANIYNSGKNLFTSEEICDIDYEKALKYFENVINSDADISAYTNLYLYSGVAAFNTGDYEKAKLYSQKSVDLGEPNADNAKSYLDVLAEKGY